jgi:cytochrome c oxidase subunit 2
MWESFRVLPEQASSLAGRVDLLFGFLVAVTIFFSGLIFALILLFAIRYRRRTTVDRPPQPPSRFTGAPEGDLAPKGPDTERRHWGLLLEITWIVIPLGIALVLFVWGAVLYFDMARPPAGSLEIYVLGKQWMWRIQHPGGQREINELHVPLGRPVKLTMTSEDVIHSFFVPAFRIKQDVLPGRYTTVWFQPTKVGEYHLFCAEYCGTSHSMMGGRVIVMEPADYERWLSARAAAEALPAAGEALLQRFGCQACHLPDGSGRGPSMVGLYGKRVGLASGESVVADETYLRQSIVNPQAKITAGYPPIMPTYQGQVSEEEMLQILAYLKALGAAPMPDRKQP